MFEVNSHTSFLVTGASGFIGRILCSQLLAMGCNVRGTILESESPEKLVAGVEPVATKPLEQMTDWKAVLDGVDTIVHLAARVHIMKDTAHDPLKEFMLVNAEATEHLAREASLLGVRRFVFMSTIGVNGDNSRFSSYTESDNPSPHNPYSVSKYEAELRLAQISNQSGLEVVTLRAPLVYGQGNPGNFQSFLKIISSRVPLPFASVNNRRSFVYVGNLADALALCAVHPVAAGKTYLISDGDDVSTPELIRRTADALGVQPVLVPFPPALMRLAGRISGKVSAVGRLLDSLSVDSSRIRGELGWKPPFTMEQGLAATAEWFLKNR